MTGCRPPTPQRDYEPGSRVLQPAQVPVVPASTSIMAGTPSRLIPEVGGGVSSTAPPRDPTARASGHRARA